jgi:hypothetical protein
MEKTPQRTPSIPIETAKPTTESAVSTSERKKWQPKSAVPTPTESQPPPLAASPKALPETQVADENATAAPITDAAPVPPRKKWTPKKPL